MITLQGIAIIIISIMILVLVLLSFKYPKKTGSIAWFIFSLVLLLMRVLS